MSDSGRVVERALFYAEGNVVFKSPIEEDNGDGSKSVTLGFPVCEASDYVRAEDVAKALCASEGPEVRAFHGWDGDLSKVEAGDFERLVAELTSVLDAFEFFVRESEEGDSANDSARALLSRLTEGGGDG